MFYCSYFLVVSLLYLGIIKLNLAWWASFSFFNMESFRFLYFVKFQQIIIILVLYTKKLFKFALINFNGTLVFPNLVTLNNFRGLSNFLISRNLACSYWLKVTCHLWLPFNWLLYDKINLIFIAWVYHEPIIQSFSNVADILLFLFLLSHCYYLLLVFLDIPRQGFNCWVFDLRIIFVLFCSQGRVTIILDCAFVSQTCLMVIGYGIVRVIQQYRRDSRFRALFNFKFCDLLKIKFLFTVIKIIIVFIFLNFLALQCFHLLVFLFGSKCLKQFGMVYVVDYAIRWPVKDLFLFFLQSDLIMQIRILLTVVLGICRDSFLLLAGRSLFNVVAAWVETYLLVIWILFFNFYLRREIVILSILGIFLFIHDDIPNKIKV